MLARFIKNENGAPSIEYCIIASLIAVAIIGAVTQLGGENKSMYDDTTTTIVGATEK